ncbi:MAG TPA: hypothetical protein VFH51_02705 [Myxococcota bacterium]|nr:hypothetical protein [Myxococcota bacterium]
MTRRSLWHGLLVMGLGLATCSKQAPPRPTRSDAPAAEMRASVDRAVATTGDLITYSVEVQHNPGIEVELPEPGARIAGLRITDAGRDPEETVDGRVRQRRWYKLRADLVGSYVLPPLAATYHGAGGAPPGETEMKTSEIFIEVASVMPTDGSASDIHDLKPLQEVRYRPRWPYALAALAVAALLAAGVIQWLRRRNLAPLPPPTPAHEVAFAALNGLRRTNFADAEAVRRYYFQISEVLRTYVEERFRLNATDLTTEEIFARLPEVTELAPAESLRLRAFLADTDRVKYAQHMPGSEEIAQTYERALGFVEATAPRPVESAAAAVPTAVAS